jgi:hypothetical protein
MNSYFSESRFKSLYVYLDINEVKNLVKQLKLKKGITEKVINEKIESKIGSILTRNSALRYESYLKLCNLAKTVKIRLFIKKKNIFKTTVKHLCRT